MCRRGASPGWYGNKASKNGGKTGGGEPTKGKWQGKGRMRSGHQPKRRADRVCLAKHCATVIARERKCTRGKPASGTSDAKVGRRKGGGPEEGPRGYSSVGIYTLVFSKTGGGGGA